MKWAGAFDGKRDPPNSPTGSGGLSHIGDDAHFSPGWDKLHVERRHRETQTTGFSQHYAKQVILGAIPRFHVMCKARHNLVELAHVDWGKNRR
jgi:hypothetical protein